MVVCLFLSLNGQPYQALLTASLWLPPTPPAALAMWSLPRHSNLAGTRDLHPFRGKVSTQGLSKGPTEYEMLNTQLIKPVR